MATKTISIDIEAYRRLRDAKNEHESFSQVIKRKVRPPLDIEAWLKKLEKLQSDSEFVNAVENQIAQRRRPGRKREH